MHAQRTHLTQSAEPRECPKPSQWGVDSLRTCLPDTVSQNPGYSEATRRGPTASSVYEEVGAVPMSKSDAPSERKVHIREPDRRGSGIPFTDHGFAKFL